MPTFSYIAKNPGGAETRGIIDAPSPDGAREELRKRGVFTEDVREIPESDVVQKPKTEKKPAPLPWSGAINGSAPKLPDDAATYAPLHETLRVFSGWLLAWYGVIYALGFLEESGKLPELPFVRELFESRLVLQFTFGTFLLLALSNVHRWLGGGMLKGFVLGVAYVALLAGFVIYG
jgi:hypothetical protein